MADPSWTFMSNHTHVLLCLAADGMQTLREVAAKVGVTERAVQRIVSDLEDAGVLERERDGRRNSYLIHADVPLRHPVEAHCRIGDLIRMVVAEPATPLAVAKPRPAAKKAAPRVSKTAAAKRTAAARGTSTRR